MSVGDEGGKAMEGNEEAFVQVEYDPEFRGGDYSGVGEFVYVLAGPHDEVEAAFTKLTGMHADCIIHWSPDELYYCDPEGLGYERREG